MSIETQTIDQHLKNVEEAFSRQSVVYDDYEKDHPILQWMRTQVRDHAMLYIRPGALILDLNAGTGLDSIFFAKNGCRVHAIDISSGMLNELKKKTHSQGLTDSITIQNGSLTGLESVDAGPFDFIFSNFGGMNCVPDIRMVTKEIPRLLKSGGFFTMVIMPAICPWELALVLRGRLKSALRRLRRNGTPSHIEGVRFMAYYFSPGQILKALGPGFRKINLQGLASISPPPYMKNFPRRYKKIYRGLTVLDRRVSHLPPFNRWADHFILTVQYNPHHS